MAFVIARPHSGCCNHTGGSRRQKRKNFSFLTFPTTVISRRKSRSPSIKVFGPDSLIVVQTRAVDSTSRDQPVLHKSSVSEGMKGDLYRRGKTQLLIQLWDRSQCGEMKPRRMRQELFKQLFSSHLQCFYFVLTASDCAFYTNSVTKLVLSQEKLKFGLQLQPCLCEASALMLVRDTTMMPLSRRLIQLIPKIFSSSPLKFHSVSSFSFQPQIPNSVWYFLWPGFLKTKLLYPTKNPRRWHHHILQCETRLIRAIGCIFFIQTLLACGDQPSSGRGTEEKGLQLLRTELAY